MSLLKNLLPAICYYTQRQHETGRLPLHWAFVPRLSDAGHDGFAVCSAASRSLSMTANGEHMTHPVSRAEFYGMTLQYCKAGAQQ